MADTIRDIAGRRVLLLATDGSRLTAPGDVNDFLGLAFGVEIDLMAIPTSRLGDDFFRLKTRLAGEMLQKFVTYRIPLAIVGDISAWTEQSNSLRDFVRESNAGTGIWFVPDLDALRVKLDAKSAAE